ncbi:class I adenylate-forming enzyme family protein [Variovorax ginsengisoli]|uniref:Fatty-acyl-CoA synthase n=1 Tax=Variovorax ginsengisoli TaxID=363844 RepID=A0ABT9SC14_9BURK|nr:AMP-binding protein [Variovorax ginsengisoli]MDP9900907.1 fatty-acyl-CoA synthase [Variovorax ginsengisoli]
MPHDTPAPHTVALAEPLRLLHAALRDAAAAHPAVVAYIDGERHFSFAAMDAASERLATALLALGLARGDRIAVLAPNQIEWLQLFFAAARIGVSVVALSPRYRDAEIEFMLADSQVKAVFTARQVDGFDFLPMLERIAGNVPELHHRVAIDSDAFGAMVDTHVDPDALARATAAMTPDDLAMVIYTSGTTGRPKGCALTHASLLAAASGQARHTRIRPGDLVQLANPFNHVGGITCGILAQLLAGGSCELVPVFKAKTVLDMIRRHPPALLVGVPTMLTLLLMHPESPEVDLGSVRLVITGGSNVDATLLAQLQRRMPQATIMNLYGLSESSGALVMTPWQCSDDDLMQSIGTTLDGAAVRVTGPDGHVLAPGEIGELQFKGLGLTGDYIGAAAGQRAFEGGWLHTGDLGAVDARGFITLKGRMKDMYIQGGFNVYPAEVEALIATHPAVVMVAGVGVPDPVLGEVGRYYVVAKEGSGLNATDVLAHCAGRIADYKLPREVVLRTELPLTPAGKIHKAQLRAESTKP